MGDDATCPLCGCHFPRQDACPSGCPLAGHCKTVCCPNCHYRFVEESGVINWLKRRFGRSS